MERKSKSTCGKLYKSIFSYKKQIIANTASEGSGLGSSHKYMYLPVVHGQIIVEHYDTKPREYSPTGR